ncbi:MAG: hypothetical protein ACOY3P_14970 [Planctomycetota bacterium]
MTAAMLLYAVIAGAEPAPRSAAQPPLQAKAAREDSSVVVSSENGTTVLDIRSKFGIDKATIERTAAEWPKPILARLHLAGLESFKAAGEKVAMDWSVPSTAGKPALVSLWQDGQERRLLRGDPRYIEVQIVGGEGRIPLREGYFEIPLPELLFEDNPQTIRLEWIDFFRN